MVAPSMKEVVVGDIALRGYAVVRREDVGASARELVLSLGAVVRERDVCPRGGAPSFVHSRKPVEFHMDHHSADLVALQCVQQCPSGGDTLLRDSRRAFLALSKVHQAALTEIWISAGKTKAGWDGWLPIVSGSGDRLRLRYERILARHGLQGIHGDALNEFVYALFRLPITAVRLEEGDVLVIDNHRMLHGRTAIRGGQRRMRRYWLGVPAAVMGESYSVNDSCVAGV